MKRNLIDLDIAPARLAPGETRRKLAPIRVNEEACANLARLLAGQAVPIDEEESALEGFSRQECGNFYFLLVAICHQTSPRGRPPLEGFISGQRKQGWDYLSARWEEAVRANRYYLAPRLWARITVADFVALFRDARLGERLSEPSRRVELVHDLGNVMLEHG